MRTTAEARRTPAAARDPAAGRRGRPAAAEPETPAAGPTPAAPPAVAEAPSLAVTAVRMMRVEEGLHALHVGELAGDGGAVSGMTVPAAHVAVPLAGDGGGVEIVAAFPGRGPWLGKPGGTLVLRAAAGGGYVLVTGYGLPGAQPAPLPIELRRIDGTPAAAPAATAAPARGATAAAGTAAPAESREIPTEILLHIERAGDRLFPGRGWVGALGRRLRIEAFTVRPLETLAPSDIEMKGFLPNGGETPWVPGGVLCGTRGRGLPLIGFALRVVPQQADRFEVAYQGSFFASGISALHQNGEPCRAAAGDDPLEAVNVRLIERGTAAPGAGDDAE